MAKRKGVTKEVTVKDVKALVRAELIKRYGSVAEFLRSDDAAKFGGGKIRCYLYDAGSMNFDVISKLSRWLGIGELNREVTVIRQYKYLLTKNQEEAKD